MNIYLVKAEDDAEQLTGLFDSKENAELFCENSPEYRPQCVVEFSTEASEDGFYYFLTNEDDYEFVEDECFLTREDAISYAEDSWIESWEINKIKLNSITSSEDNFDENGNIIKPEDEDDLKSCFYNAAMALIENNVSFTWEEIECEDGPADFDD